MRISDWSSDVCSSDLPVVRRTARILPAPADLSRRTSPNWSLSTWLLKRRKKLRKHRLGTVPTFEPVFEFLGVEVKVTPGCCMHCKRSEEHTSELQSLMRISYAVFCLKKKKTT